jgi:hypothetical protein
MLPVKTTYIRRSRHRAQHDAHGPIWYCNHEDDGTPLHSEHATSAHHVTRLWDAITVVSRTKPVRLFRLYTSLSATLQTDAVLLGNSASNLLHSSILQLH